MSVGSEFFLIIPPPRFDKIDKITEWVGAKFRCARLHSIDKIEKNTGLLGARFGGARHFRIDKIDKISPEEVAGFVGGRYPRIDKIDKNEKLHGGWDVDLVEIGNPELTKLTKLTKLHWKM